MKLALFNDYVPGVVVSEVAPTESRLMVMSLRVLVYAAANEVKRTRVRAV